MTVYLPCPNGCDGEVPMEAELVHEADPTVGIFRAQYGAYVDMKANATSHAPGCDPLTEAQILALQDAADDVVNEPEYWVDEL